MADDRDEIDWLGPAGFILQPLVRAKKPRQSRGHRGGRSAQPGRAAFGRLLRVIQRRPEVMVKITGSARGFKNLKEHLAYITRNGKLLAESETGELIEGSGNVRSLAADWWSDDHQGRAGRRRDTVNIILSMPPGTSREAVAGAAKAFARSTFAGRYDYLMVAHEDTEHPHVHLTVKTHGLQDQYLNPRKDDLQAWREAFAEALRARGVKAEATPRRARGVVRKGQRQAIRHMDSRSRSRVTQWKLEQAIKHAKEGVQPAEDAPWVAAGRERQRKIRRAWETIASAFDERGQVAAAVQVKQFLDGMPPAKTEGEAMLEQAEALVAAQEKQREKARGRGA